MNHPSIHSVLPPKRSHLSPGRTSQSSLPHEQLRLALQNKKGNVISKLVGSCKNMGQQSFAEIVVVVCPKKLSYLVSLLVDPLQRFSCHNFWNESQYSGSCSFFVLVFFPRRCLTEQSPLQCLCHGQLCCSWERFTEQSHLRFFCNGQLCCSEC